MTDLILALEDLLIGYAFFGFFGFGLAMLLSLVLAIIFVPQKLQQYYLKEPYFSKGQCFAYTFFPGSYFFIGLMMWANAFPRWRGKKPNMQDIRQVAPLWYQVLLWLLFIKFVVMIVCLFIMSVLYGLVLLYDL